MKIASENFPACLFASFAHFFLLLYSPRLSRLSHLLQPGNPKKSTLRIGYILEPTSFDAWSAHWLG